MSPVKTRQVERKIMASNPNQWQSTTQKASSLAVVNAFSELQEVMIRGRLLEEENRYSYDTINRLKDDFNDGKLINSDITRFIAASVPAHLADAWGFFARSIHCLTQGDTGTARHLAYYAELRASNSILCSQGIGIFNNHHFVVDNNSNVERLPLNGGTHSALWAVLDYWSSLKSSWSFVERIITPEGMPLKEWTNNKAFTSYSAVAKSWLKEWGIDLSQLSKDRSARNFSSYQPSHLASVHNRKGFNETFEFIDEVWNAIRPGANFPFENLDRHLLRIAIEKSFSRPKQKDRFLDYMKEDGWQNNNIMDFLERKIDTEDLKIICYSRLTPDLYDPGDCFGVISRATLLIRIASGACRDIFQQSGTPLGQIDCWLKDIGVYRGLWKSEPEDYFDLWTDISENKEKLSEYIKVNPGANYNNLQWDMPEVPALYSKAEMGLLWGCKA